MLRPTYAGARPLARLVLISPFIALFALAQATGGAAPKTPPKPKPKTTAPPAKPGTAPADKSDGKTKDSAAAPKGFSRMEVTPDAKTQFEADQRYAVVVAPNYSGSDLNALRFTVADILELKSELERQGYVVRVISPAEATSEAIRNVLIGARQLFEGKPQSTFLFAFSGHGFLGKDAASKDRNYLVTLGVTRDRLAQDALPLDEVEKLMSDSGARRKMILIDACRNDPSAKSTEAPRTFAQFQEAEGTSILLSTRPGGFSYEDKSINHGIFTYYVLEGLRGKAAGKDGYVTFYDLEKYVENSVVAHANKLDLMQRPFVLGEHFGDFLVATAAPPKPGDIVPIPKEAQQVDSNTAILWEIAAGGKPGRSFYGLLDGTKLTLVNNKTLAPLVELTDTEASDLDANYRHFKGTEGQRLYDIAVQMKGDSVASTKGRIGTPCPTVCTTTAQMQLLLLPGEKLKGEPIRQRSENAKKGIEAVKGGIGILTGGRGAKGVEKTQAASDMATKGIESQNALLHSKWEEFDLTSNMPKPAAR